MADQAPKHHCKRHPIAFDLCDMDMDLDISRWILEFLFRNVMDESFIRKVISSLPFHDNCFRLKKTLLLRAIESDIIDGSVSEKTLNFLETIAHLDIEDGHVLFESMKSAYCAVAVDCTARFVEDTGNGAGPYFDAVKRIWRERIGNMENPNNADLASDQLRSWKEDIEAAVYDENACKKIANLNTRKEALKSVRAYVSEAWKIMGPTFLELVTKKMGKSLMEAQKLSDHDKKSNPVEEVGVSDQVLESFIRKVISNVEEDTAISHANSSMGLASSDEHTKMHKAQVQETAANSSIESDGLGANNRHGDGATSSRDQDGRSESAVQVENQLDEIARPLNNDHEELNVNDQMNFREKDPEEEIISMEVSAPGLRHKEVENRIELPKHKKHGKRFRRRVRIVDGEELPLKTPMSRFGLLDITEVRKAQETLQTAVKDPLPEALKLADAVISGTGRDHITSEPSVEPHDRMDVDVPGKCVAPSVEAIQASENTDFLCRHQNDNPSSSSRDETNVDASAPNSFVHKNPGGVQGSGDNHGIEGSSHQNNETRQSLMDRNGTAQTYKWDDSVGGSSPSSKSPKRSAASSLKKYAPPSKYGRRRAIKRWSNEEEDTLRTGVDKFGLGKWKMILFTYRHVFNERTEVDLKDKWRNLMK